MDREQHLVVLRPSLRASFTDTSRVVRPWGVVVKVVVKGGEVFLGLMFRVGQGVAVDGGGCSGK